MSNNQRSGSARTVARVALAAAIALSFSQTSQADFVQVINVYADPFTHVGAVDVAYDSRCSLVEAIRTANNITQSNTDCGNPSGLPHIIELPNNASFSLTGLIDTTDGPNGLPSVTSDITINGHGSVISRSTASGTSAFRIFHISSSGILTLNQLTVSHGLASDDGVHGRSDEGGGILAFGSLTLNNTKITGNNASTHGGGVEILGSTATLNRSELTANIAGAGGGAVFNNGGVLTLNGSTVSSNIANQSAGTDVGGGGIEAEFDSTTRLNNSTVSHNSAQRGGGLGIEAHGGAVGVMYLVNSTVSNNSATISGDNVFNKSATVDFSNTIIANSGNGHTNCASSGTLPVWSKSGHNISDDGTCFFTPTPGDIVANPKLGPLTNNGGPTKTHALLAGSPAIDAGDDTICRASPINNKDQRGYSRAEGAHCDIGAYELDQTTFFVVPASNGKTVVFGL